MSKEEPYESIAKDLIVCPICNGKVEYNYRHYRHIGDYYCKDCNFKTPKAKYIVHKIDKNILVNKEEYFAISKNIYNVYNELQVIALFKELGYDYKTINKYLKNAYIPKSRENLNTIQDLQKVKIVVLHQ